MGSKRKYALWVYIAGIVVCLAARIYQIIGCTDMTSGFLYHEDGIFGVLVYLLPLLLVLGGLVVTCLLKGDGNGAVISDIVDGKAAAIGFGTLLIGVCAVYGGVEKLSSVFYSKFSAFVDIGFGTAITVIAFITLYLKEFRPGLGFSYFVSALYFTLRGVLVFLERMVITTVAEYLIECLISVGTGLFFMLFCKLFSGNGQKRTRGMLCVVGGTTSVLALSSSLATIVADIAGPEEISSRIAATQTAAKLFYQTNGGRDAYMLSYTPWVFMAAGLMMGAVVIVLCMQKKADNPAQSENVTE